jgi:hypothetical protein
MPANPTAIHTKSGQRLPVNSTVEVVNREKALYVVALGWSYRFRSNGNWLLVPLDTVSHFEFESRPEGQSDRDKGRPRSSEARSVPHGANYVTPEGDLAP